MRVGTGLDTIFENHILSTQVPFSILFPDPEKALQCSHNFLRLSKLYTNPLTHSHATQQLKHTHSHTHTHTHKPGSHLYPRQTAVAEEAWPERCCRTCGCSSCTTPSCGRAWPGWETGLRTPAPDQRECSTVAEVGGPSWTRHPDTAGTGSDLRTQSSTVIIPDCFYIALLSALKQTHSAKSAGGRLQLSTHAHCRLQLHTPAPYMWFCMK